MTNDDARTFLESVAGYTDDAPGATPSYDKPVKLGTVDALYAGSGNPKVLFDGETLMGVRAYPYSGRQPRAGDRVVLLPQGHSYVIIGSLGDFPGAELPVGTLLEGLWSAAPTGYLLLDGTVLVRATYPALFAILGTTYNTGGETGVQFRLPDFRGRVTAQKTASGTFATLGGVTGAELVTLTAAQIPAHQHPFSIGSGGNVGYSEASATNEYTVGFGQARVSSNDITTGQNQGGGGSHNNVQPTAIVNRAVRY